MCGLKSRTEIATILATAMHVHKGELMQNALATLCLIPMQARKKNPFIIWIPWLYRCYAHQQTWVAAPAWCATEWLAFTEQQQKVSSSLTITLFLAGLTSTQWIHPVISAFVKAVSTVVEERNDTLRVFLEGLSRSCWRTQKPTKDKEPKVSWVTRKGLVCLCLLGASCYFGAKILFG